MMDPPHLRQRKRAAFDFSNSASFRRKRARHDSHSTTIAMNEAASCRKILTIIGVRPEKDKDPDPADAFDFRQADRGNFRRHDAMTS